MPSPATPVRTVAELLSSDPLANEAHFIVLDANGFVALDLTRS